MTDKDQAQLNKVNGEAREGALGQTTADEEESPKTSSETEETQQVPETQEIKVDNPNVITISDIENKKAHWYVVHTYSGHENKVAETLKQRADTLNLTHQILKVLIPTQEKIQIKRGQRKTIREKIFPGYMLVFIELSDQAWLAVRTTQGVTGFVGIGNKPTPLPKHEVETIQKYISQGVPQYKAEFVEGEAVKITDGPFNEFLGTVQSIDEDKGNVEVLVSIFGRETPVELDFLQVQKV